MVCDRQRSPPEGCGMAAKKMAQHARVHEQAQEYACCLSMLFSFREAAIRPMRVWCVSCRSHTSDFV